jgi:hypothetical protein
MLMQRVIAGRPARIPADHYPPIQRIMPPAVDAAAKLDRGLADLGALVQASPRLSCLVLVAAGYLLAQRLRRTFAGRPLPLDRQLG